MFNDMPKPPEFNHEFESESEGMFFRFEDVEMYHTTESGLNVTLKGKTTRILTISDPDEAARFVVEFQQYRAGMKGAMKSLLGVLEKAMIKKEQKREKDEFLGDLFARRPKP